jgi:hypothetical protein
MIWQGLEALLYEFHKSLLPKINVAMLYATTNIIVGSKKLVEILQQSHAGSTL